MTVQPSEPRRLVLAGSVLVDLVMRVEELPGRGADVQARSAHAEIGGGFPTLVAARRHGLAAALAGGYGSGPFGTAIANALAAEGIDPLLPRSTDADSGFRTCLMEPGDAQTSVTSPGLEARLSRDTLAQAAVDADDAVYVSGRDLAYQHTGAAIAAWIRGLPRRTLVVFDPGPWVDDIPWPVHERTLRRSDLVTMSQGTAGRLLGTRRPAAALQALHAYAPRMTLGVIRCDADGCWVDHRDADGPAEVPAPPLDVTSLPDPDGVHTGVLVAALAHGVPAARAALRANVAAALHAATPAVDGCPDAAAVDRFLATRWAGY